MKLLLSIGLICFVFNALAQNPEIEARNTIETFFDGFHQQDSMIIKQVVSEDVI